MTPFAQKLKKVREETGLSQKDLAEKLGIGPVTMNRIEKGSQPPDSQVLITLRRLFGVDLNWLLIDDSDFQNARMGAIPLYDETQLNLPADQRCRVGELTLPGLEGGFCYRVRDEVMLPIVRQQDYVIVQEEDPRLGDLALCMTKAGIVQVRRMSQHDNNMVLLPDNTEYGRSATEVEVVFGKVCTVVRSFET